MREKKIEEKIKYDFSFIAEALKILERMVFIFQRKKM